MELRTVQGGSDAVSRDVSYRALTKPEIQVANVSVSSLSLTSNRGIFNMKILSKYWLKIVTARFLMLSESRHNTELLQWMKNLKDQQRTIVLLCFFMFILNFIFKAYSGSWFHLQSWFIYLYSMSLQKFRSRQRFKLFAVFTTASLLTDVSSNVEFEVTIGKILRH